MAIYGTLIGTVHIRLEELQRSVLMPEVCTVRTRHGRTDGLTYALQCLFYKLDFVLFQEPRSKAVVQ
jgi:hypothetical protein